MINALKKTIAVCLIGLGRNIISSIASNIRLAIYNRNSYYCRWNYVDNMLAQKGCETYDYSRKESSKVFKGNSKTYIWNKR